MQTIDPMIAGATLRIDCRALAANFRLIQDRVRPAQLAAVVKADGYGLGALVVSAAFAHAGCSDFFVAHLSEAIALRPALDSAANIYVLNGLQPGAEELCAATNAIPVLNTLDQIRRWRRHADRLGRRLPAVLQVDSGMARLGLAPNDIDTLLASGEGLDGLDLRFIMSHLACADDPGAEANTTQFRRFEQIAARFPSLARSLDNSGGAFLERGNHLDLVRAGVALYGGAPQAGAVNPMHPVVQLESRLVQVRDIPAGAGVGYGLTFASDQPRRIGTIAMGYADGWSRHLSNKGSAFISGFRVPIAGRVSMDSITLDVTEVPSDLIFPGATVELLGPNQTIDDVAADAGTISYEILTQLGDRYAREYLPCSVDAPQGSIDA